MPQRDSWTARERRVAVPTEAAAPLRRPSAPPPYSGRASCASFLWLVGGCLALVSAQAGAQAWRNVRVDHENREHRGCFHAAITAGPGPVGSQQALYVAIENDSFQGANILRQDVCFQRSLDGGRTWLPQDKVVRYGAARACWPDITCDPEGGVCLVYTEYSGGSLGHICCARSSDQGETWSAPGRVDDNPADVNTGWARIASDSAGCLFAAWNDLRTGFYRIWSSVSFDHGQTWQANVRVDDDTVPNDLFHADVFVQPGSNDFLAVSSYPCQAGPGSVITHSMFTRSTDQGRTFRPCVVLDTFSDGYCGQPHVVAGTDFVACDYTGSNPYADDWTQARFSTDGGASWSGPQMITGQDPGFLSYGNGGKLGLAGNRGLHAALMVGDTITWEYRIFHTVSNDRGATWSPRELVSDAAVTSVSDPDIAVDSAGHAYVLWQDGRNHRDEIWFATNLPDAVAERAGPVSGCRQLLASPSPFRCRVTFRLSPGPFRSPLRIFDAGGRLVREALIPRPSSYEQRAASNEQLTWDGTDALGRRCAPGAYVATVSTGESVVTAKVLLLE